jgi:hypothetical protein
VPVFGIAKIDLKGLYYNIRVGLDYIQIEDGTK